MEEKFMKLENSSVSSLDTSDMDSITDESNYSLSSAATTPCKKRLSGFKASNDDTEASLDVKEMQRKRRQKRVEILRSKRQRKSHGLMSCVSTDDDISSSRESFDLGNVTDPQLLRKLRNRESAARSRQKIIDLIDTLTFQLMERYVTLKDLQDQVAFLEKQKEYFPFSFGTMAYSQYPSSHPTMIEVIPWSSTNSSNSASPTFEMQLQEREFYLQQQTTPEDVEAVLNGLFTDLPTFSGGFDDIDGLYRGMLFA